MQELICKRPLLRDGAIACYEGYCYKVCFDDTKRTVTVIFDEGHALASEITCQELRDHFDLTSAELPSWCTREPARFGVITQDANGRITSATTMTVEEYEDSVKPDNINHPAHYTAHPSGLECIDITRHMNFNLGNVVKYIWRSAHKNAELEDLKKARWYLDDEIKRLEG